MDEPFGALDAIIRGKAQEDLLAIQRRLKTTIVLVTHDMEEAFHLGDRIAVLDQGRLLQFAEPAQLVAHPADEFVARLCGTADRAFKLLSLTTAGEAAEPGPADGRADPGTDLAARRAGPDGVVRCGGPAGCRPPTARRSAASPWPRSSRAADSRDAGTCRCCCAWRPSPCW